LTADGRWLRIPDELSRYQCRNALWTAMQSPKFAQPVTVRADAHGAETVISDVYE
jgi:hypothetical protein